MYKQWRGIISNCLSKVTVCPLTTEIYTLPIQNTHTPSTLAFDLFIALAQSPVSCFPSQG